MNNNNYLAHFSTEEEDNRGGTFTMLVAAKNIDDALLKFEKKIRSKRNTESLFSRTIRIHIDIIIQIEKFPLSPSITFYESRNPDNLSKICTSQLGSKFLKGYDWNPDDEEYDETVTYPFIDFEASDDTASNPKSRK